MSLNGSAPRKRSWKKIVLSISILFVFLVGIGVGAFVNNQTTIFKPTTYTVNIQNSQFQLNQATMLWAANGIRLDMTNLQGGTLTDQVQITFFNGTSTSSLGTSIYSLTFTSSNETAAVSLGGWGFQLVNLATSSRILIAV